MTLVARRSTARPTPRTAPGAPPRPGGSRFTSTTTASRARWSRLTARPTSWPATTSSASLPRISPSTSSPPTPVRRPPRGSRRRAGRGADGGSSSSRGRANKPENIRAKLADGKLNSWFGENGVLLDQPFVKDSTKTVREVLVEVNARTGENITVGRFARFIVGETAVAEAGESEDCV